MNSTTHTNVQRHTNVQIHVKANIYAHMYICQRESANLHKMLKMDLYLLLLQLLCDIIFVLLQTKHYKVRADRIYL